MSVSNRSAEPRRLYQQVADQIRLLVQSGVFLPGSRLPAERDLSQQLGVSRPSLREALIALEIDGSVEIRMGSGIYVCPPREPHTRAMGDSPSELMQARAVVEGALIVWAAARMTPEALAALHQTLADMRVAIGDGRKPLELDRQFHLTIAALSGNSVLTRMVTELFDERHSPISAQISAKFENRDTWAAALREHELIYQALENKDPLTAQSAMRAHLEASKTRWVAD